MLKFNRPAHYLARSLRRIFRERLLIAGGLIVALFFSTGCAAPQTNAHEGEKYLVNAQRTLFYKFGPAQPNGPDLALYKGQRLTMLGSQFGYSHVATEEGVSGYVSSEDLVPAPPEPAVTPAPSVSPKPLHPLRYRGRAPTREEELLLPPPELPGGAPQPRFRY